MSSEVPPRYLSPSLDYSLATSPRAQFLDHHSSADVDRWEVEGGS